MALAPAPDVFDVLSRERRRTWAVRRVGMVAIELGIIRLRGMLDLRLA
jgi:hypothetical protein